MLLFTAIVCVGIFTADGVPPPARPTPRRDIRAALREVGETLRHALDAAGGESANAKMDRLLAQSEDYRRIGETWRAYWYPEGTGERQAHESARKSRHER